MEEVLLILFWLKLVTASVYFHESSFITLNPDSTKDHATFGFSMALQHGILPNLIVGAPQSNLEGTVFDCPLADIFVDGTNYCGYVDININKLAPYNREYTPNLKLNLGTSIAATSNYFLTCAPLWTTTAKLNERIHLSGNFSYGTCFVYRNGTAKRYNGILEQYMETLDSSVELSTFYGGTGWKTVVDMTNNFILLAKIAYFNNIVSIDALSPLEPAISLLDFDMTLSKFYDVGYSMAAGNFFSLKQTVYAVSAINKNTMRGVIIFLETYLNDGFKSLLIMKQPTSKRVEITDDVVGSLFGAAMFAVDLNKDGFSDLLVGAPAQGDGDRGYEVGALHIYLGGNKRLINDRRGHYMILANKDQSRFGTAITGNDIDGDGYSEIIVSAPYENQGVIYIIYGQEITRLIKEELKIIFINELKYTQRIEMKEFRQFGYSLQIIPDLNNNGCSELAVGAPGSDSVILFRGVPAVYVNLTARLNGTEIVSVEDLNFTVNVCINVRSYKNKRFFTELFLSTDVIGNGAYMNSKDDVKIKITERDVDNNVCRHFTVNLIDSYDEPSEYRFISKVYVDENNLNTKNFDEHWVTLSPQSTLENIFVITQNYIEDSSPDLSINIRWKSGLQKYILGTSEAEIVSLEFHNNGHRLYDACAWVKVSGATVSQTICNDADDGYKCYLPTPLRRNETHTIDFVLNMTHPDNSLKDIFVEAKLYDFCNKASKDYAQRLSLELPDNQVSLQGLFYNQTISDGEIQNEKITSISYAQEYWVINEGPIHWMMLRGLLTFQMKPFINFYKMASSEMYQCDTHEEENTYTFNCTFNLMPRQTLKFIANVLLDKNKIVDNLVDGKLTVLSSFDLFILPSDVAKHERLSAIILYQKDISLGQHKDLIVLCSIIGAVIVLACIAFALFKIGFFKRQKREELKELKEDHIRRKNSVKTSTSASENRATACFEGIDIEDEDDSAFENTKKIL